MLHVSREREGETKKMGDTDHRSNMNGVKTCLYVPLINKRNTLNYEN